MVYRSREIERVIQAVRGVFVIVVTVVTVLVVVVRVVVTQSRSSEMKTVSTGGLDVEFSVVRGGGDIADGDCTLDGGMSCSMRCHC